MHPNMVNLNQMHQTIHKIVVDGITFDKSAFDMLQSLVPEEQLVEVHMQMDHGYAKNVQLTAKNIVVDQPKVNTNLP